MKRILFICGVILAAVGISYAGWNAYENHVALASSSVTQLPAGYIQPSASFLRELDNVVAEQTKFQADVAHLNSRVPQGYTIDLALRGFKPPTAPPAPVTPPANAPATPAAPAKK
jgi:hypothetical protein